MTRTDDLPPFLPPRRPTSMLDLPKERSSTSLLVVPSPDLGTPPPFLPPRRPSSSEAQLPVEEQLSRPGNEHAVSRTTSHTSRTSWRSTLSRPTSLQSIVDTEPADPKPVGLSISDSQRRLSGRRPPSDLRVQALRKVEQLEHAGGPAASQRPPHGRHSSVRSDCRQREDDTQSAESASHVLGTTRSEPVLRPQSHPPAKSADRTYTSSAIPPAIPAAAQFPGSTTKRAFRHSNEAPSPPSCHGKLSPTTPELTQRPRASLSRLSSLDSLITYREEKAQWKRDSLILQQRLPTSVLAAELDGDVGGTADGSVKSPTTIEVTEKERPAIEVTEKSHVEESAPATPTTSNQKSRFRHITHEICFCFTIAMTQFLAEYLISGFALELPRLFSNKVSVGPTSLGTFWPASLLTLVLSATLLIFARVSDLYGGYPSFMFGAAWLTIWTIIPAFCTSEIMIDVSRAMEGLALAAFMPSTFAMVATVYEDGPRKNFVIGLYSGCAPIGFFAGFLVAGALPDDKTYYFFWIAAVLSFVTLIGAYVSVPKDHTDRKKMDLKMDWLGSFLITAGLLLLAYSLAVEPYANQYQPERSGFSFPIVWAPFCSGVVALGLAVWVEGWVAKCPLLPFDFFEPKSVKAFCLAGLCFYASYGVWLYISAEFFQSSTGTTDPGDLSGIDLAIWYTPTAVGGLLLCVIGGGLAHIVPIKLLLLVSGLAWIAAPLLLALAPLPLHYWSYVMPSMVCATIGIDLTFTVSLIFLAAAQPQKYQGLAGAVSSILVNLAMSFSLPLSEIVMERAKDGVAIPDSQASPEAVLQASNHMINWGFQAAFLYGAASAGLGLVISVLFVHISRKTLDTKEPDEEARGAEIPPSEASTLVGEREDRHHGAEGHVDGLGEHDEETPVQSTELAR